MDKKTFLEDFKKALHSYYYCEDNSTLILYDDFLKKCPDLSTINENYDKNRFSISKLEKEISRLYNAKNKRNSDLATSYYKERVTKVMEFYVLYKYNKKFAHYENKINKALECVDIMISRIARLDSESLFKYLSKNPDENFDIKIILENKKLFKSYLYSNISDFMVNTYITENMRGSLEALIPENPKDEYKEARRMYRHFILHVGLTNTGKTYEAINRLKMAKTGIYLGPLRLLALEVQETLNTSGVLCSLLTGEEEDIIPDAKHISSTVEKLNINKKYDVCVIDECQLISDKDRGFAWTRAILGVQAPEIHLCMAPEALGICKKIIDSCEDTYEVVDHQRKTELIYDRSKYEIPKDIQQGDALIVFSRREVLEVAEYLKTQGIFASVIYGALPYSSRKKQLERFLSGETKVVVSTDAIGMGLNLPIRRIIFLNDSKYDGHEVRELLPPEVKQIAGRAGRYGMYDEGYVLTVNSGAVIENGLNVKNEDVEKGFLGFPDEIVNIPGTLTQIVTTWKKMKVNKLYVKTDIDRLLNLSYEISYLQNTNKLSISKEDQLKLIKIPFDETRFRLLNLWETYIIKYFTDGFIKMPKSKNSGILEDYEIEYKCLELYYSFSKAFDLPVDLEDLKIKKESISKKINTLLIKNFSEGGGTLNIQNNNKKRRR